MSSVTTAVHPDKDSVYFQGSLTQMQSKQYANINRDNVTFLEIIKQEPRKQSYIDTTEFDSLISRFPFLSNKFIYKKVIDDARVIPDDIVIKNRMDEYFSPRFYKNILRIYQNAPLYFDYLFSREGISEQRHKQYSVYMYTLCLIEYIMKHYDSNDFKLIRGYQLYYDWALPKYSEQVSYIIKGPLSKSSSIKIDFKKHYATIMNPSNVEGDMTQFLQLASLQNLDAKLNQFFSMVSKMNNAYDKLKDEARTYNLVIRARNTKFYNDPLMNNTFVIDLRGSDFGETDYATTHTASLDTVVGSSFNMSSRLSLHKLQELFTKYSRIRIVSLNVNSELYNIKLNTLDSVEFNINGISLASRTVNVINSEQSVDTVNSSVTVTGRFNDVVNGILNFSPFIDITTYNPSKVRVTDARIYLSSNGIPLSAKNMMVNADEGNLYNVSYNKPSTANNTLKLINVQRYTKLNTMQRENIAYLASQNNLTLIYDNDIYRNAYTSYFSGTPLLLENSSYIITYSTDGIVNMEKSTPSIPTDMKEFLELPVDQKLQNLTIQIGDIMSVSTDIELLLSNPQNLSYNDMCRNILAIGHMYDGTGLMAEIGDSLSTQSAPNVKLGYGYYAIYHHRATIGNTEICTVSPNNMLIYPDDVNNLQVTIKTITDTEGTRLVLQYTYTDKESEAYNDIPLTINAISFTDTINIYYYDIGDNTIHGYYGSFEPNDLLDSFTEQWYYSPIVMHSPTVILSIVGAYSSSSIDMYPATFSNGLYYVQSYAPLVYSDHININGAILMKPIDRLGYGNGTLMLTDSSGILHKNIRYISWEDFTILPSLYMTNIGNKDITIALETVDDLFNVQLEFS